MRIILKKWELNVFWAIYRRERHEYYTNQILTISPLRSNKARAHVDGRCVTHTYSRIFECSKVLLSFAFAVNSCGGTMEPASVIIIHSQVKLNCQKSSFKKKEKYKTNRFQSQHAGFNFENEFSPFNHSRQLFILFETEPIIDSCRQ